MLIGDKEVNHPDHLTGVFIDQYDELKRQGEKDVNIETLLQYVLEWLAKNLDTVDETQLPELAKEVRWYARNNTHEHWYPEAREFARKILEIGDQIVFFTQGKSPKGQYGKIRHEMKQLIETLYKQKPLPPGQHAKPHQHERVQTIIAREKMAAVREFLAKYSAATQEGPAASATQEGQNPQRQAAILVDDKYEMVAKWLEMMKGFPQLDGFAVWVRRPNAQYANQVPNEYKGRSEPVADAIKDLQRTYPNRVLVAESLNDVMDWRQQNAAQLPAVTRLFLDVDLTVFDTASHREAALGETARQVYRRQWVQFET